MRFALKAAADPNRLLEEESKSLHLDPRLKELLGRLCALAATASRLTASNSPRDHTPSLALLAMVVTFIASGRKCHG
jgi:hypothetical protein